MTIYAQRSHATHRDTTSSTTDAIRVWPGRGNVYDTVSTTAPVLLWSHPSSGNQTINPGYFTYPLFHAAHNLGWVCAAALQHGDSWGNTNALDDTVALNTYISAHYSTGPRIIIAASMGGLAAQLLIPDGRITNIKGVYTTDGVFSLISMYSSATYRAAITTAYSISAGTLSASSSSGATSVSSTVSYPSGTSIVIMDSAGGTRDIVTTTGAPTGAGPYTIPVPALSVAHASGAIISDYPTKTAGHDPMLMAGSAFGTVRQRFIASSSDTVVSKTLNTDAFNTLLGSGPLEKTVLSKAGGHLSADGCRPRDFIPFAQRCIA